MIDPTKITNYNRTIDELEELCLFVILVAGKNATTTARMLDLLLQQHAHCLSPFDGIRNLCCSNVGLPLALKSFGFGCFNLKAESFRQIVNSNIDLRTCTCEDLEKIKGIGMKTSRFFILHSRENAQVACLDTHLLKWLKYHTGHDVPEQTPSKSKYLELEKLFLDIAKLMKVPPAVLDINIWNKSRGSDEESLVRKKRAKEKILVD